MKLRNFIIVLLAIFMVFALASCKNEPEVPPHEDEEEEPIYSESVIYKLTATKGRNVGWWSADKFVLSFSADSEKASKGSVLTLKYRSTREITQFNIRNSSNKWIYEQPKTSGGKEYPLPEGFKSEPDADGWITVTFTFGDKWWDGTDIAMTDGTYSSTWRIDFIGEIVTTDVLEVKDIKLNDTALTLTQAKVSDSSAYGNIMPTFEETHIANWQESSDWVVFYFEGEPGEADGTPEFERVFDGMTISRDWKKDYPEKEHYTVKLLTGYATNSAEFDPATPITKNTRLFIIYVGDSQKVTFDTGEGGPEVAAQTVEYGTYATKPDDPTKEGVLFAGWYVGDTPFDFENTEITSDTVITAKWGAPTVVSFDTQVDGITVASQEIPAGTTATEPEALTREGYRFDGWFTASTCLPAEKFDFTTQISEAKTLYAGWTAAKVVTFNANYEGAPKAEIAYVEEGGKVAEPEKIPAAPAGYIFGGWYTEAECTNAYDFESAVNADTPLFAKWTLGTLYQLIPTLNAADNQYSYDKIGIKYADGKVSDGDILSFRYRTTKAFQFFSVRGAKKWIYQNDDADSNYGFTTYEAKDDGWTYVTFVFDSSTGYDTTKDQAKDAWFEVHFGNRWEDGKNIGIEVGDILEIQGWAINGNALAIEAANLEGYVKPTVKTIEGGAYEWTAHDVTFNPNNGSDPSTVSVAFNDKVELPDDPEKAGFVFMGWFTDDETFENEFDETANITEAVSVYAKWVQAEARTVTFYYNYQDADPASSSVTVYDGLTATKPADPAREGYFFDGWTIGEAADSGAYDFTAAVTGGNLDLYAQWTQAVTLTVNLNYGEAPESKTFTVRKGTTPVVQIGRAGYYLSGLTEAADASSDAYEVGSLDADKTVYAQWEEPAKYYKLTATKGSNGSDGKENSQDKFALQWSSDIVVNAGDVVSMAFKPVRTDDDTKNRSFTYSIRGAGKWFAEKGSGSYPQFWSTFDQEDGWIYVTYVFPSDLSGVKEPKKVSYPGTFRIDIRDTHIAVGDNADVVYIKALAINGVKIELDEATTSSQYACPDIKYENLPIE